MAESGLYDNRGMVEHGAPTTCPRCGRIFEGPIKVKDDDGTERKIQGHVQGDPVLCVPLPTMPELIERDARRRRDKRRGRAK